MADLLSFSNTLMSSSILFLAAYIVLSSTKFTSSTSLVKKKSFKKILNTMGPDMEPFGIPDKSIWKTLSVSLIFTPCFLRFKYEYAKVTTSSDKSYAWSFETSKSRGIQSKVY